MTRQNPHLYEFGPFLLDTRERLLVRRDGELIPLHQGDYAAARRFCEASLVEARASGDKRSVTLSSRTSGPLALLQGEHAAAHRFLQESLALGRELDDEWVVFTSLSTMAELARTEGDYAAARRLNEECLLRFRGQGNREAVSVTLCNLGAAELEASTD